MIIQYNNYYSHHKISIFTNENKRNLCEEETNHLFCFVRKQLRKKITQDHSNVVM